MNRFRSFSRILAPVVLVLAFQAIGPDTPPGTAAAGQLPIDPPGQETAFRVVNSSPTATDLVVDAIEVTQSMQNLNNSVPLISGKRTFVRVYVHSNDTYHITTAFLKLQVGAFSKTILPIPPGGAFVMVRPVYTRLLPSQSFLFEIPKFFTLFTNVTLTAEVNPQVRWHPHNPVETSYLNNTISKTVGFESAAPLHLVIAAQPYYFFNQKFAPRLLDEFFLFSWLQRVYPISQVKLYLRTLPTLNAKRKVKENGAIDLTYPDCYWLNSYLAYNRAAIYGIPFFTRDTAFYGMVADSVGFMRGCSPVGGKYFGPNSYARVASGPSGNSTYNWDFDGSYADWYGGHELGHTFNQSHVHGGPSYVKDGCGGEAYALNQHPDGRISPTLNFSDPKAIFGFDAYQLALGKNPVLSPYWHDVMTYCNYQWMSDTTYLFLKYIFQHNGQAPLPASAQPATVQDMLAVFGSLDLSTGQVTLQPVSILFDVPDATPPTPGDYAIVLRDGGGGELTRYAFTPYGAGGGQSPYPSQEEQAAYISELVPYVSDVASLEIEGPGGGVLAQASAEINPPEVHITEPTGSEILTSDPVTVTWTASDPDSDPLTFNLDYSLDNGQSWEPVGLFYTTTLATVDQIDLPASSQGRFRVTASDGLHSASDTSNAFTIPNHLPSGDIIDPPSDITVAVSQTVSLEGQVYDYDLGSLDDANLEWTSSQDGFLGNGASFSTADLTSGVHVITLSADDGGGWLPLDQVTVTVKTTPNELPVTPDALDVGPDPLLLFPNGGVISGTIYVDDLNLGNVISWTARVDQAWLSLDMESGQTPQDVTVFIHLPVTAFGVHTATITFTSPQAPLQEAQLEVVVTIPEYDIYLPILVR